MRYTGTVIAVKDIRAARRFYEELFGLEVYQDYGRNITFTCGISLQQDFGWLVQLPADQIGKKPNNVELCFDEEAFDAFLEKLKGYPRLEFVTGVIELGRQPAGKVVIRLSVTGRDKWISAPVAAGFDEAVFKDLADGLKQGGAEDLMVTDTAVTGRLTAPQDGVLFTTIPMDSGWSVELDGEQTGAETAFGAFLAVPVTAGEHSFRLVFCPKGLKAGAALSIAGCLFAIVWIGMDMRKRRQGTKQTGETEYAEK